MTINWKKYVVVGVSFGVGAVASILFAIGVVHLYSLRPKPWDTDSIKCLNSTAVQTFNLDERQRKFTPAGFELMFVVENTTSRDYTIPEDLKLFKRVKESSALDEWNGKLSHAFVMPPKERAEIRIAVEYGCSNEDLDTGKVTERDSQTCFNDAFGDVLGFVGLDNQTRTRLNFPKPTFASPDSKPDKKAAGSFVWDGFSS